MKNSVCLIGVGEMGSVFARGLLKAGYPVFPVTRDMNLTDAAKEIPTPEAVVVAVAEKDLHSCLENISTNWRDRLVLLQNELLPHDWEIHKINNPTVISVWFEKKYPQDYKVIIPSPIFGPHAELIKRALEALKIPIRILKSRDELIFELVLKNFYILTINIAGLEVNGTVGELWNKHNSLARAVANDVLDIQFALIKKELNRERLTEGMVKAFEGDLNHKCLGRTALARLERALAQAKDYRLPVKTLNEIYSKQMVRRAPP